MKRLSDVIVSLFLLLVFFLPMLLIALFVRIRIGSPVFFVQQRPGLHGKPFLMMKFRSMTDERDSEGRLLPDSVRLTSFGRFLRASSIDELPELWNVLKGEMSLVGPRPLLMQYVERYSDYQARRHEVRPGITGWAQVMGRNSLSWDQKFALDVWYVDNQCLSIDAKILLMTVVKVFKRDGISAAGAATMTEFLGSDSRDA